MCYFLSHYSILLLLCTSLKMGQCPFLCLNHGRSLELHYTSERHFSLNLPRPDLAMKPVHKFLSLLRQVALKSSAGSVEATRLEPNCNEKRQGWQAHWEVDNGLRPAQQKVLTLLSYCAIRNSALVGFKIWSALRTEPCMPAIAKASTAMANCKCCSLVCVGRASSDRRHLET